MYHYAELNEYGICVAVSTLSSEVTAENLIQLSSYDEDKLRRKYENGQWSADKFEPQTTAPLTEFEQLKQQQALMQAALDDLILGGGL